MTEATPFSRTCPVCGYVGAFRPHRHTGRANATCPNCRARERHRMLVLYLTQGGTNSLAGKSVLHFSPEALLDPFVAAASRYETADLEMENVDHRIDITAISLPDQSFDVILCNHVLEHVPDDASGLRELYRILRPAGRAIITVPVIEGWDKTYEDPAIRAPEDRALHFGRYDHVRFYGRDIRDRITSAGFDLEVYQPTPAQCVKHAVTRGDSVFIGHKS